MHIRLAKQAQHQGSDEVKDLAERIEKDFTKWSERWENFADKRDARCPPSFSRITRKSSTGSTRPRTGRNSTAPTPDLVADHLELMVQDFQAAGQRTQTPAVQRLAKDELPVIRDLLARAAAAPEAGQLAEEASDRK